MKLATKILSAVLLTGVVALANTLVTVNGKAITQQAVNTELMNATQGRFNQVPAEKQAEFRQQVLQQLIGKELIYGDAKKTGVLKTKEYKEEYKKHKIYINNAIISNDIFLLRKWMRICLEILLKE